MGHNNETNHGTEDNHGISHETNRHDRHGISRKINYENIDFPNAQEKEQSIAWILSHGTASPQKLSIVLWRVWDTAGLHGIFFGVWDCMMLALLLDGFLWAAVYMAARQDAALLYLLVFLASPLLYAMLHLLTVWKETMTGMYQILSVCRLSMHQLTALRLLFFAGVSAVLSGAANLGFWACFLEMSSATRLISLSTAALFFYAWMQMLLEWKWNRLAAYAAPPALWGCFSILLLLIGERGQQILAQVPTAALFTCAVIFAALYLVMLRKYSFAVTAEAI